MISQYANSPVFTSLDSGLINLFDDSLVTNNWYNAVFNIATANAYGLDIWGKILDRSREFVYNGTKYYLKGAQTIGGVSFTDSEMEDLYRKILQLIAMRYIGNASIASINNMLQVIFKNDGKCYCYEYDTMQIRYVFEFYVNDVLKAVIETLNPHPTGVLSSFEYLPLGEYFGFITRNINISINNLVYSRSSVIDKVISGVDYYGWVNGQSEYYTLSATPSSGDLTYTITDDVAEESGYNVSEFNGEPYAPASSTSNYLRIATYDTTIDNVNYYAWYRYDDSLEKNIIYHTLKNQPEENDSIYYINNSIITLVGGKVRGFDSGNNEVEIYIDNGPFYK